MAKIERVAGSAFTSMALRRKDAAEDSTDNQKREQPPREEHEEKRDPEAERQAVEKAIADLKSASQFGQTGIGVEMVQSAEGLNVKLVHPSGVTIRTMSAEEFLKLRDSSAGDRLLRGKILDQKL